MRRYILKPALQIGILLGLVFSSSLELARLDSTQAVLLEQLSHDLKDTVVLKQVNKLMIEFLDFDPKKVLELGLNVLDKTMDLKETHHLADIHNTIASAFLRQELLGMALDYYDKGLKIFSQSEFKSGIAWNHLSIGNVYYRQEFFDLAAQKYFESAVIFEELADTNGLAVSLSNLGLIQFNHGDYGRAEDYMHQAIRLRKNDKMNYRKAAIRFPLIKLYLEMEKYEEAGNILMEVLEYCNNTCGTKIQAKLHYFNAAISVNMDELIKAEEQFLIAASMGEHSIQVKSIHELITLYKSQKNLYRAIDMTNELMMIAKEKELLSLNAEAHQIMGNLYIELGESEKALDFINQAITIVNDIREENVTEVTTRTEVAREVRSWEKKFSAKNREIEHQKLVRNNWVISTVSLIIFIIFLIKYYVTNQRNNLLIRKQGEEIHSREIIIQNQENEQLSRELTHKKNELTSKSLFLAEKQKSLEEIKSKLNELNRNINFKKNRELKNAINIVEKQLSDIDPWEEFHITLTELYPDFLEKLNDQYPNLNNNDHRLCGLLKLGFNSKQIAEIRNISLRGIEQHRYRLRRKMALTKQEKLPELLQNI